MKDMSEFKLPVCNTSYALL